MKSLSTDSFLKILGLGRGAYDMMQFKHQVALAFQTPQAKYGRYMDLDLVAMVLASTLAPLVGRKEAATIVLSFFDVWVSAVGRADADPSGKYYFAIGAIGWQKKRPALVTSGTAEEIAKDFAETGGDIKMVDVGEILASLRQRAHDIGISLETPFFFSPDDPRHSEIVTEAKEIREERITRLRADKKKEFKNRMQQHDIEIAARVRDARVFAEELR